jgi:hypothetical protein
MIKKELVMLKKILIGILAAVVIVAIGASAYNAFAAPANSSASPLSALGFGQGNGGQGNGGQGNGGQGNGGQGNGGQGNGGQGNGSGVPNPQANISGKTTVHGIVSAFNLTTVSLTTADGSSLVVQLGNSYYAKTIGFAPKVGETLTVAGFPGDQGLYSAITITNDITGKVYTFRDPTTGRPMWAGGQGKGNGKSSGTP